MKDNIGGEEETWLFLFALCMLPVCLLFLTVAPQPHLLTPTVAVHSSNNLQFFKHLKELDHCDSSDTPEPASLNPLLKGWGDSPMETFLTLINSNTTWAALFPRRSEFQCSGAHPLSFYILLILTSSVLSPKTSVWLLFSAIIFIIC